MDDFEATLLLTFLTTVIIPFVTAAASFSILTASDTTILAASSADGRCFKRPRVRRFASRVSQWEEVQANNIFSNGWFRDEFRCSRGSFDKIEELISAHWELVWPRLGINVVFSTRDRVAVTMNYLMHSGNVAEAAKRFGMCKASALNYIHQVCTVQYGNLVILSIYLEKSQR